MNKKSLIYQNIFDIFHVKVRNLHFGRPWLG